MEAVGEQRTMKAISRPTHGIIDYVVAGTLVGVPYLIKAGPKARNVFLALAAGHAAYSLFTRYEMGAVKKIPFKGHMALDGVFAAAWLAAGALLGNETPKVRATMAAVGLSEVAALALTAPEAETQQQAYVS